MLKVASLDIVILVLLLLVTLVIFGLIIKPPALSDPLDYFFTSLNPSEAEPTHRHLRLGLIWPVWLLQKLFGYSELSYYTMPLLGMVTFVLGTFFLGKFSFNRLVGVCASLLLLLNPSMLRDGAHLLPDFLSAGLFCLAFVFAMFLGRRQTDKLNFSSRALLLCIGLLLGWSYLIREHVALFFPFIAFYLITIYRRRLRNLLWVSGTAAACLAAEFAWNWLIYGNPLMRFLVSSAPRINPNFETVVENILLQLPKLFLAYRGGWVFATLFFLALIGCVGLWRADPQRWSGLLVWFVGGWTLFTMISLLPVIFFDGSKGLLRMSVFRYWAVILPPMLVAGLGTIQYFIARPLSISQIAPNRSSRVFPVLVFLVFSFTVGIGAREFLSTGGYVRLGNTDYQQFRRFVRERGREYQVIWLNQPDRPSSIRSIPIYLTEWHGLSPVWAGEIRFYNSDPQNYLELSQLTSGMLVIDLTSGKRLMDAHDLPDYIMDLGLLGPPIFESSNRRVFAFDLSLGNQIP